MSEQRERRRGVDAGPEERDRSGGPVDPTGHVSSGVQTGPLRASDDAPVAATDEARRGARPERGTGDIMDRYRARRSDDEERS